MTMDEVIRSRQYQDIAPSIKLLRNIIRVSNNTNLSEGYSYVNVKKFNNVYNLVIIQKLEIDDIEADYLYCFDFENEIYRIYTVDFNGGKRECIDIMDFADYNLLLAHIFGYILKSVGIDLTAIRIGDIT